MGRRRVRSLDDLIRLKEGYFRLAAHYIEVKELHNRSIHKLLIDLGQISDPQVRKQFKSVINFELSKAHWADLKSRTYHRKGIRTLKKIARIEREITK